MAVSQAISGFGTLLQREDPAVPGTFAVIAEVGDITPPELTADTAEVTHQQSPGGFKEYIATLKDGGEVSFDINFRPGEASHKALIADLKAGVARNFKVVYPDGSEWSFTGLVTGFAPTAPMGDKLAASVTIKVTGEVTTPA